jgi:hypothetical protein
MRYSSIVNWLILHLGTMILIVGDHLLSCTRLERVVLLVTYGQVMILEVWKSGDNLLLQFLKRNLKICDMLVLVGMMMVQKAN